MNDDTLRRLFDRLGIGEGSALPVQPDPLASLPEIPRPLLGSTDVALPSWRSIVEPEEGHGTDPALAAVAVAAPPKVAPPVAEDPKEVVLKGEFVHAPRAYGGGARRMGPVALAEFLYRVVSFSISALGHVTVGILLLLLIVGATDQEDVVVSIVLGRKMGKAIVPEPPGEKAKDPEPKKPEEKVEEAPPPPAPTEPAPPQPVEPRTDAPPVEGANPKPSGDTASREHIEKGRSSATRGDLLKKYGGSDAGELSVELGLEWLSRHQAQSGEWDGGGFHRTCPKGDSCQTANAPGDPAYTHGITGLSILAFLGAGYSPKQGKYAETVEKALDFILRSQHEDGGIDNELSVNMYNHAIATWALCETYAVTHDERYAMPAQRALEYMGRQQYDGGGWDYYPAAEPEYQRNDTSIAGWAVMAMRSGKIAGLKVPPDMIEKARKLIAARTDPKTGELVYSERKPGVGRKGLGLLAVGMLCRFYLDLDDLEPLKNGAQRLLNSVPSWEKMEQALRLAGPGGAFSTEQNMYAWYYGTLAMFQMGGEYWNRWNKTFAPMLLARQHKKGHKKGSWDPEPNYIGREGGRVFSTAINVLNLEVYYRYLPIYETNDALKAKLHWDPRADVLKSLKMGTINADELRKFAGDEEIAALVASRLKDTDMTVRLNAVKALIYLNAREHLEAVAQAVRGESTILKGAMLEYLLQWGERSTIPIYLEALDSPSPRVQEGAVTGLKKFSGQDYGYDKSAWERWFKTLK